MAIYRGSGGSTSTTDQATIDQVAEDAATATTKAAEAASSASSASSSASSASTSATNAASSASSASSSASSATSSASNAASSASSASSSATAAADSATSASGSATNAASEAAAALSSLGLALDAQTAAEAAEANAILMNDDAQKSAYGAEDVLQTLSDSSTLYSARHYAAKAAASDTTAASSAAAAATSETNAASSAAAAQAAEDAALAALDSFDDRYLGQKASDPTLDNDGNALVAGALYFNTTDDVMKVYEGSTWVAAYASLSGALLQANNLSDLANASSARTNLGLGTAATTASTDYATAAQGTTADAALPKAGGTMTGAITFAAGQTFDGRDVSADGTKLDGIESGATADQTAQEIATAIDADATAEATLKSALGLGTAAYTASTAYATAAQGTNADTAYGWGDHSSAGYITGNQTITLSGDVSGSGTTSIAVTVADDSHNHVISNVDGLQTALDAKAALSGASFTGAVYSTGNMGYDSTDYISWSNNTHMNITINGSNEFRFEADGDFHADGDVIAYSTTTASDERLKDNISVVDDALSKVCALNGVTFKWKKDGTDSAGVIAQEVMNVLPQAVKEVSDLKEGSHLAVNYGALTSILIEAIKELSAEVEALKGAK